MEDAQNLLASPLVACLSTLRNTSRNRCRNSGGANFQTFIAFTTRTKASSSCFVGQMLKNSKRTRRATKMVATKLGPLRCTVTSCSPRFSHWSGEVGSASVLLAKSLTFIFCASSGCSACLGGVTLKMKVSGCENSSNNFVKASMGERSMNAPSAVPPAFNCKTSLGLMLASHAEPPLRTSFTMIWEPRSGSQSLASCRSPCSSARL
mmetsp:Transcript_3843/g.8953  ORF Transcript_3843/g.8953 Transcript_3843/m.8953 type:complete len:207 (-) Transcript_3843:2289-2909(-)